VRRILRGDERGPKRDAVLLNAAAGLFVANRARTLSEGWDPRRRIDRRRQGDQKARRISQLEH